MQHPGRVSFKFIDKMQLVSGFWLGTVGAREQGWLVHGGRSPDPQSPLSSPFAGDSPGGTHPAWPGGFQVPVWAFCGIVERHFVPPCFSFPQAEWDAHPVTAVAFWWVLAERLRLLCESCLSPDGQDPGANRVQGELVQRSEDADGAQDVRPHQ